MQTSLLQIDELVLIGLCLGYGFLAAEVDLFQLTPLPYFLYFLCIRYLLQSTQVFARKAVKSVYLLADL